jgi:hypothetical protein
VQLTAEKQGDALRCADGIKSVNTFSIGISPPTPTAGLNPHPAPRLLSARLIPLCVSLEKVSVQNVTSPREDLKSWEFHNAKP